MHPLYRRVPSALRPLAVGAAGWWKGRRKYGRRFRQHLAFLQESTAERQLEVAATELRELLRRLRRESRFYAVPQSLRIEEMPRIDKAKLLGSGGSAALESPFTVVHSSGTTGTPLAVPYSLDAYQKEYAFWWHHRAAFGVRRGDRVATIAGHPVVGAEQRRPPYWVRNVAENQLLFSSYHLAPANLDAYLARLDAFEPQCIHGYPSSIYLLARRLLEHGRQPSYRPRVVVAASETTLDFQREAIERAFGCPLAIWYGNAELCGHVTECPRGRLHTQPYHSRLRVVGSDGVDVAPGQEGRIVATNWTNLAFPLINYDTGDVARLALDQDCPCGGPGPLLESIVGRVEDYILAEDGRHVGRLDHLLKPARHVRLAQLEQRREGELIVRIVRGPEYDGSDERAIADEARLRLGPAIALRFDYVEEIPRRPNGKYAFVLQHLPRVTGTPRDGRDDG